MINACNDCGNAIEECSCEPLHEALELSDIRVDSQRVEGDRLIVDISARVKGALTGYTISGVLDEPREDGFYWAQEAGEWTIVKLDRGEVSYMGNDEVFDFEAVEVWGPKIVRPE